MKNASIIGWIARILCIAAIAFISIFALDAFDHGSFGEKLLAFAMHMIPSFILALALWYAWKHELGGGILFLVIGIVTAFLVYRMNYERTGSSLIAMQVIAMIN